MFACHAVSGILANPDPNTQVAMQSAATIAQMAYEVADEMVRERDGGKVALFPVDELDDLDLGDEKVA